MTITQKCNLVNIAMKSRTAEMNNTKRKVPLASGFYFLAPPARIELTTNP